MRAKTLEQIAAQDFAGLQVDQLCKLRNGNLTFEQVKWFNNLSFDQREALMGKQPALYLKLLSSAGGEPLILDALDGKETLLYATDVFTCGIDPCFKSWGTNKPGMATKKQKVAVYELVKDARFEQMYNSLETRLENLCLTQSQIKNFCKKYHRWVCQNNHDLFFLFEVEEQFLVARVIVGVIVGSDGLYVSVHRQWEQSIWRAESAPCLVVPQLNVNA